MATTKPTVLLVDDIKENILALENVLRDLDCEIISIQSGKEAISLIEQIKFCCVLLDVHMPDIDGFDVAKAIRTNKKIADTPIIFVTASEISVDDSFRGYELGAVDYLIKPLNPDLVRTKVDIYCELFRSRQAVVQSEALAKENEVLKRELELAKNK